MGWTYGYATKTKMIAEVTRNSSWEGGSRRTLAKKSVGKNVWAVMESTYAGKAPVKFIALFLTQRSGGQWGYKDMTHDMGPYEVNVPPPFLAMLSDAELNAGHGGAWAARVRAHWARTAKQEQAFAAMVSDDVITLVNGWKVRVTGLNGKYGSAEYEGQRYRFSAKDIAVS
jgi:hypothetical protein